MNNNSPKIEFEVAIIGAGFAGLCTAIRLLKAGRKSFVIFERGQEVGGTWRDNIYPGCGCDVPSHLYSFSFEPNPNWSRKYSQQPEILNYLKFCVDKYGLAKYLRLNTEIAHTVFDESNGFYTLTDRNGQKTTARVVVCALGPLNRPNIPNLAGLDTFQGKTFHSSAWDYTYDLSGKRVAVIGTGASAIQFVPQIANKVAQLYLFQRTPPWVLPKPDGQFYGFEKSLFRYLPSLQKLYRSLIYWRSELLGLAFLGNETLSKLIHWVALQHIRKSIKDPALQQVVTPHYKMGCKRVLVSEDYYPALQLPNVTLINDGIAEIRPDAIVSKSGTESKVDAIIFGTGFFAAEFPPKFIRESSIIGRNGRSLLEEWNANGVEGYYGMTISGYPNFIFLVGPNTGLGHNSIIHIIESQVNYLLSYLSLLDQQAANTFLDLKPHVQEAFNEDIQQKLMGTVWASGCKSWYLNEKGRNTTIWPGLNRSYRQQTRHINPDDYAVVKSSGLLSGAKTN